MSNGSKNYTPAASVIVENKKKCIKSRAQPIWIF